MLGSRKKNFARQSGDAIGSQALALLGMVGFLVAWGIASRVKLESHSLLLLFFSCTAIPMVAASIWMLRTHQRETSGLGEKHPKADFARVGVKLVGLAATLALAALCLWLFPEYRKEFYKPMWMLAAWAAIPAGAFLVLYFFWADRRMKHPYDGYWHLGAFLLGKRTDGANAIKQHLLAALVKTFFLPLMIASAVPLLSFLAETGVEFDTFGGLYASLINLVYSLDVVWGVIGYALTLRVLDSQVRSTEPTWLGWVSAIMCYPPFATFVWGAFLAYKGNVQWNDWLADFPVLFITWGFVILVLHAIYVWATISFGCRFSNLTNRGIITEGPYRLMKHPAYVSKNLAWWLMYAPFAAHGSWDENLRASICLLLTNFIYAIRAWTEERHLLKDPAYQEYSQWIAENGLAAQLKALWPFRPRTAKSLPSTNI